VWVAVPALSLSSSFSGSVVIRRTGGESYAAIILLDNVIGVDCTYFPHANSSRAGDDISLLGAG
jgi:hypothetical protein